MVEFLILILSKDQRLGEVAINFFLCDVISSKVSDWNGRNKEVGQRQRPFDFFIPNG